MEISYFVSAIAAGVFWGLNEYFRAKRLYHGTAVKQCEAMNGVYRILAKTKRYTKSIVVAERHDETLQCLILDTDPPSDIIKIEDGHMSSFS